jgi:hypothetical protein
MQVVEVLVDLFIIQQHQFHLHLVFIIFKLVLVVLVELLELHPHQFILEELMEHLLVVLQPLLSVVVEVELMHH